MNFPDAPALALATALFCVATTAAATDVRLVGVAENTAILMIDDSKPRMMRVGQTGRAGVKLVAVDGQSAVVEVDGERLELHLGDQPYAPPVASERTSVTLVSDVRGHFVTAGNINGASVRLMVDSGASMVSMGPSDAKRAGIDYLAGNKTYANTANGVALAYHVRLNKVQVGDIVLYNVEGLVHENINLPVVLLGMSFLGRLDMRREGDMLTLSKRD